MVRLRTILYILLPLILVASFGYLLNKRQLSDKIALKTEQIAPKPTQILSSGLPVYHLINTTFVPQAPEKSWDQPWQDACEEAALLTLNYYYTHQNPPISQIKSDLLDEIQYENTQNWGTSINLDNMSQIAISLFDLQPQIISNPTIDQIRQSIANNAPVIVPANGKTLYQENKHFKDGGPWYHNLVILGYDDNKQQFITHDVGTQFGAYFHYSYDLLMSSIHDLPDSRNIEQIDSGIPKVLILIQ